MLNPGFISLASTHHDLVLSLHQPRKKSQREIAKAVGISQATVQAKVQIVNTLSSNRKGKSGRKKKTTPKTDAYSLKESKLNLRKIDFQLQQDLASAVVSADSSTVRRRFLAVDRKTRRTIKDSS